MKTSLARLLWISAWLAGMQLQAQTTINWNSDPSQTNLTSTASLLDGQFRFELGVFAAPFVPLPENIDQWAAHWSAASRTAYVTSSKRFAAALTPTSNVAPFTVGAPAYIWGFRGDAAIGEWILLRASSWTWPSATSFPISLNWLVGDAVANPTAIVGALHVSGSPFQMQTAAVSNAAPPTTSWAQWQADSLAGVTLNQPADDPDHDGAPNLLEYVFGTPPKQAGALPATPVELVWVASQQFQQITIPRRIDHPAALTVEVSADLTNWQSGAAATAVVSDGPLALVVRDLTPSGPGAARRFMRLKAELLVP